jgi:hypothetical protein
MHRPQHGGKTLCAYCVGSSKTYFTACYQKNSLSLFFVQVRSYGKDPHKALHSRNALILSAFFACELYSPFYSYSYLKIHVQGL